MICPDRPVQEKKQETSRFGRTPSGSWSFYLLPLQVPAEPPENWNARTTGSGEAGRRGIPIRRIKGRT